MILTAAATFAFLLREPDVIANVRKALLPAHKPVWQETVLQGEGTHYGEKHKYTFAFTASGKFLRSFEGPIAESFGSPGEGKIWQVDRSGAPRLLDFSGKDQTLLAVLALSDRWLDPHAPVTLAADGYTINVKLKETGKSMAIQIDPATSLPATATVDTESGKYILKMSDWKAEGGRMLPHKFSETEGPLTDTMELTSARPAAADKPISYSMPSWRADDTTFDASKPSALEVTKAISGHILVHPLVNGKDVGWFILDSGAEVMVLDTATADELKLDKVGNVPITGVGGTIPGAFRVMPEFSLGPITIRGIKAIEIDLKQIGTLLRVKLAGVVGADVFRRSVVKIAIVGPKVDIYNPASFQLSEGKWSNIRFNGGNPTVEGLFEGHRAWFRLDTGANGTVVFHAPFVQKEKLLTGSENQSGALGGVGGSTAALTGKIKWFELGGHRFENPSVIYSQAKSGAFADTYLAGNIGHDFMRPFDMVFDYGNSRIAFVDKGR